jgi:predicted amidophosphoribosyltransferase
MAFSERLPHACPDCNGWVNLESMICEGCGLEVPHLTTVPDVYALLYPDRRIGDVDAFIDDVLGGDSS